MQGRLPDQGWGSRSRGVEREGSGVWEVLEVEGGEERCRRRERRPISGVRGLRFVVIDAGVLVRYKF